MHHALIPSVIFSAVLLLAKPSGSTGDPGPQTSSLSDDGLILSNPVQVYSPTEDIEEDKRGWRDLQSNWGKRSWKNLHSSGWGKRGWRDLHSGGWGKRAWSDLQPSWGKRGWQDLQGSWGKRDWNKLHGFWGKRDSLQYGDDSYEDDEPDRYYEDEDEDLEDILQEVKRAWNNLKGNWGKRDWSNFKGSWGKRDPAWHNLKGLWGKRSTENKWNKLQAVWGKRSNGGSDAGVKSLIV